MRTKLKNYSVSSILPRRVGSHQVNRRKRDDENELFYNLIQIDWILYSDIDAAPRLLLFSLVLPDKLQHKIQNLTLDQKSYRKTLTCLIILHKEFEICAKEYIFLQGSSLS